MRKKRTGVAHTIHPNELHQDHQNASDEEEEPVYPTLEGLNCIANCKIFGASLFVILISFFLQFAIYNLQ
jgi:hypothetical protein